MAVVRQLIAAERTNFDVETVIRFLLHSTKTGKSCVGNLSSINYMQLSSSSAVTYLHTKVEKR